MFQIIWALIFVIKICKNPYIVLRSFRHCFRRNRVGFIVSNFYKSEYVHFFFVNFDLKKLFILSKFYICSSSTPESWFQFSRYNKERADSEVQAGVTLGEAIEHSLSTSRNELQAQKVATEFAYRKRLHEQERAKGELEWQEEKVSYN